MIFKLIFTFLFSISSSFAMDISLCGQIYLGQIAKVEQKSFLYNNLLKNEHIPKNEKMSVVDDITIEKLKGLKSKLAGKKLDEFSTVGNRMEAINHYKISNITAAPGHRQLRNKKQIKGLVKYITESNGGDFRHDKILFNIVIDKNGNISSLDLWNAHHRLVAYMEAGYKTIRDLDIKNIEVLVNGRTHWGETWEHYLSISGVDDINRPNYRSIMPNEDIRQGTIGVSGHHTNYTLGSRNTLGQLHANTFRDKSPKIGVYFGTFDPIHEGHIRVIKEAIKGQGFDEVVIVPNVNPIHKSGATPIDDRLELIARRIDSEEKINLYVGDSATIIDQFGRNPFFERMTQTYGTYDLHQIIGSDSYLSLAAQNQIQESAFRKYLVFQRKGEAAITEFDAEKVTISAFKDDQGLSSTKIRNQLKAKQTPPSNELHPSELEYIKEKGLYGSSE